MMKSRIRSKLFDACELGWILNALNDSIPVFDVSVVVFNSRVKDIGQTMLAHEDIR